MTDTPFGTRMKSTWEWIKFVAELVGAILLFLAVFAYFFPWVEKQVRLIDSSYRGAEGYVYYEVDANETTTGSGDLTLILSNDRRASRKFEEIQVGDLLQITDAKSLRGSPSSKERNLILIAFRGECLLVREPAKPVSVDSCKTQQGIQQNKDRGYTCPFSAGWLKVSTISCGLFN